MCSNLITNEHHFRRYRKENVLVDTDWRSQRGKHKGCEALLLSGPSCKFQQPKGKLAGSRDPSRRNGIIKQARWNLYWAQWQLRNQIIQIDGSYENQNHVCNRWWQVRIQKLGCHRHLAMLDSRRRNVWWLSLSRPQSQNYCHVITISCEWFERDKGCRALVI